jgi:alpha-tubulin suppressor-like RCC1 family protein
MARLLSLTTIPIVILSALSPSMSWAQTVAAGSQHTVVRTPDGAVWTWGGNSFGQLGDGTTTQRTTPVHVSTLTDIAAVAAGAEHTLALEADGTVWAWGRNNNGQLGDGTITGRQVPTVVPGLPAIAAISAGSSHSVALSTDGTIWTWGYNFNGQLGDGTTTRSLQPLIIVTGWTATGIAAGHSHTLAIRDDGTLWGWGANYSGQLGAASPTQWNVPAQIAGVTGALFAAGGSCHTAVVRTDGRVLASGCNTSGQLGSGNTTNRPSMDLVSSLLNASKVYAGASFTTALTSTGQVWSWGQNFNGQLGDGTTSQRTVPAQTLTTGTVSQVATGHNHGVAATSTGVVLMWGLNSNGQLGDGTLVRRLTPIAISDVNYEWKVATPILSSAGGNYSTDQTVIVTNATAGAEIHYSLDGDDPTLADPTIASGGNIVIDRTTTLKVRAWNGTMPPSDIVTAVYTMTVAWPSITPNGGTYTSAQTVSISTTSPGVTLRYTTDNSTPTEASPIYSTPLQISTTTTVKAIGFRTGWSNSLLRSATYQMNFGSLDAPVLAPGEGTYTSSVTVTITALAGASIRYTTNGMPPNAFSTLYTGPLTIATPLTLKAIAIHPDYGTSPVATAIYSVIVAAPLFTPAAGTYNPGQAVTVSCATPGATIRFTLDGRDPTTTDPIIANNGTLLLGNYTLKARAFKTGVTTSEITSATYQLNAAMTSAHVDGGMGRSILVRSDGLAWAWGTQPGNGTFAVLSPIPTGTITGITSGSAGGQHTLLANVSGSVYAWGGNLNGQVGDGSTSTRLTAVLLNTIASVAKVAAGGKHSIALKTDGTVWAWGANNQGQVGDGTTTQRTSPVAVAGLSGVTAVAAGEDFSLALKSDGTVWSWGDNAYGQLGSGTTTDRLQPAAIAGLTGVTAISAGFGHGVALRNDGSLWAWGHNISGQLGLGSTGQQLTPAQVTGLPVIVAIAAGGHHSLALATDGSVLTWGLNNDGQLGDGTTQQRSAPAPVILLDDIVAVGAGSDHSLAIAGDGTVWAWGDNDGGELGDGTSDERWVPEPISGPGYNWKAQTPNVTPASAVYSTTQTAVVTSGDPGATLHYTLNGAEPTEADPVIASGASIPIDQSTILKVNAWKPGAPTSVTVVRTYELKALVPVITPAAGSYSGSITATVSNPNPQGHVTYTLDGSEPTVSSPTYSSGLAISQTQTLKAIAHRSGWTSSATSYATYWITDGTVATPTISPAAGPYDRPQLVAMTSSTGGSTIRYTIDGSEPTESSPAYTFAFVVSATTTVKAKAFKPGMLASAAAIATYALDAAGAAATPTIVPAGGRFTTRQTVTIQAPAGATVRYTTDGSDPDETDPVVGGAGTILVERSQVLKVRAWDTGLTPSAVRSAFFVMTGQVTAGFVHTVALKADGTVWSWGYNFFGTVGDGSTTNRLAPVQVGISDVQSVAAGYAHTLALKQDGSVWAWGLNNCGQLGDNTNTNRSVPVQVTGLTNVIAIAAGGENAGLAYSHSLALRADGTVWAWGCNQVGQLGDATTTIRKVPVQVIGVQSVKAIAAGGRHSYALADGDGERGIVWAWGNNDANQIGDTSGIARAIAVRVPGVTGVIQLNATRSGALTLKDDRSVWAWGGPASLRLNGPSTPSALPVLARVLTLGSGDNHAFALDAEAIRWAWGVGSSGQLGIGTTSWIETSAQLASHRVREQSPFTIEADGGESHSVLLRSDGSVAVTGENMYGQLGTGTTVDALAPTVLTGFSVADNAWLATDDDGDGLTAWRESLAGTDPYAADSNGNGILDGIEDAIGTNGANPDSDGDGLTNVEEFERGTDAAVADTDGDGVVDGADVFPLDPTRSSLPPPDPLDTTPPVIILTQPASARPVGGGGGL